MADFSFTYAPKASAALASINPLQSKDKLQFTANTPFSFIQQRPEVVAEGFWKGRQALTEGAVKGVLSAMQGVTGALTSQQEKKDAEAKATLEFERAKEIAKIKSQPSQQEEIYKANQIALQNEQIRAAQQKYNESTEGVGTEAVKPGQTDFSAYDALLPKDFSGQLPEVPAASVPVPAAPAAPAVPAAAAPAAAPQGISQFAPGDAGKGLFQFAQTPDAFGNFAPRQASMAFNLGQPQTLANEALPSAPSPEVYASARQNFVPPTAGTVASADNFNNIFNYDKTDFSEASAPAIAQTVTPSAPNIETKSIFGRSTQPNFVALRDKISPSIAKTQESNLFSDISAITPTQPQPADRGYRLKDITLPSAPPKLPESEGNLSLAGQDLTLVPVYGAEGPMASAAPAPALSAVTAPPAAATPAPAAPAAPAALTREQRYQIESGLTARPYESMADARRAKEIVERALGVKAKIVTEKGEKGTRLNYVEITDEATSPMESVPAGMVMKQVTDKDGNLTTTYVPAVPIKQQTATLNNNIEKAKVLKTTIEKIEKIAPGYLFAGAGGISGLMQYQPWSNDARTVRKLIDTVKGIVGFDELVALKAAGGTLGALSDSELNMLTSLKGSVDPDLSEGEFMENMKSIRESTEKLIKGLEQDKKDLISVEKKPNFQPIQTSPSSAYKKGDEFYNNETKQTLVWDGKKFNPK